MVMGIMGGFFLFVISYGFNGGTRTFIRVIAVLFLFLGVLPLLQFHNHFKSY